MAEENDPRPLGSAQFGDRCPSLVVVVVDSWIGELRCGTPGGQVKETVKISWNVFVCRLCAGETQEEHFLKLYMQSTNLAV